MVVVSDTAAGVDGMPVLIVTARPAGVLCGLPDHAPCLDPQVRLRSKLQGNCSTLCGAWRSCSNSNNSNSSSSSNTMHSMAATPVPAHQAAQLQHWRQQQLPVLALVQVLVQLAARVRSPALRLKSRRWTLMRWLRWRGALNWYVMCGWGSVQGHFVGLGRLCARAGDRALHSTPMACIAILSSST